MEGARRFISQSMGFSKSSMPGSITPPDTREDTCPLCGHFMPLNKGGYCGTEECTEAATQAARKIARKAGGNVPGLYYKIGEQEIVVFSGLPQWKPPQAIKHPDMCTTGECTEFALPADCLCRHHRLGENAKEYRQRREAQKRHRRGKRKSRKPSFHGNNIRGLDKVKI